MSGREYKFSLKQCSTPTQADDFNSYYNVKKLFACNIYEVFFFLLNTLMILCLSKHSPKKQYHSARAGNGIEKEKTRKASSAEGQSKHQWSLLYI